MDRTNSVYPRIKASITICGVNFIFNSPSNILIFIPSFRLRKLELSLDHYLTQSGVWNTVILQPDLRHITMHCYDEVALNGSADWIEKCSKLTHLEIRAYDDNDFAIDEKLLHALSSRAQLRELVLRTCGVSFIDSEFENCRKTFDHLRTLELELPTVDYRRVLEKVSVNLNRLSLTDKEGISTGTLKFISSRFVSN